jgi:hypothetical protein
MSTALSASFIELKSVTQRKERVQEPPAPQNDRVDLSWNLFGAIVFASRSGPSGCKQIAEFRDARDQFAALILL